MNTTPKTLAEMIAAGKYDSVDSYFQKQFSEVCKSEMVKYELKHERYTTAGLQLVAFTQEMGLNEVYEALEAKGLRPAYLEELLAFGAENPEVQLHATVYTPLAGYYTEDNEIECPYLSNRPESRPDSSFMFDYRRTLGYGDCHFPPGFCCLAASKS